MTLYQIKPLFQSLLRPTMFWLYKHHVTANHITLAALALSLLTGLLLVLVAQPILFLLLPIVLFIRMALNALDGMLARECNQQTRLGAILNETGDVISDIALYLPFLFLPESNASLVILMLFCTILGLAVSIYPQWMQWNNLLWSIASILLLWTAINRCRSVLFMSAER
ncbi:CDP-alcohol phosphatidyltransferase family protein [Escherichia coli]|nr:CDP-alcohol phosphatidyltransferase family protein [Escherichia coli]